MDIDVIRYAFTLTGQSSHPFGINKLHYKVTQLIHKFMIEVLFSIPWTPCVCVVYVCVCVVVRR